MLPHIKNILYRIRLLHNRLIFHLFFKNIPGKGDYCNSKLISQAVTPSSNMEHKMYLVYIRSGTSHCLINDAQERNFDIALNLYEEPKNINENDYEYIIIGGLNKYKAAYQFIDDGLMQKYKGFIFLDDDLEISCSDLGRFLNFCTQHQLSLAQPSLTRDSYYSHNVLLNVSNTGMRTVNMVEVMCPYFSSEALSSVICTFDLSYSTWGLDHLWPRILKTKPVVVDEFTIKHTKPMNRSDGFYRYMRNIGISPERELAKLKNTPLDKLC